MKKIILSLTLLSLLTVPFFASAQVSPDRNEVLIQMLNQLVIQFEQEIAALSLQTAVPVIAPVSNTDDTLSSIKINGTNLPDFTQANLFYNYLLPAGTDILPVVTAETNNINATEVINQSKAVNGSAIISVTAKNGITNQTYIINFSLAPK